MRTVDSIVQAAGTLFAERGYECAPIVEIAERAGVAAGTIIYHFKHKEHLLAEVALRHLKSLHAACQEQATRGRTGLDSVLRLVDAFHGHVREHRVQSAAYYRNFPTDRLRSVADLAAAVTAAEQSLFLLLDRLVAVGVNDGSISPEAAGSSRSILAMLLGGAFLILFQNGDAPALAGAAVGCARRMLEGVASTGAAAA